MVFHTVKLKKYVHIFTIQAVPNVCLTMFEIRWYEVTENVSSAVKYLFQKFLNKKNSR